MSNRVKELAVTLEPRHSYRKLVFLLIKSKNKKNREISDPAQFQRYM